MRSLRFAFALAAILVVCIGASRHRAETLHARSAMSDAAAAFLGTLTPPLRANANLPFESENRLDWHFVPRDRKGVKLADLDSNQRRAAHRLLQASLSSQGYLKTTQITELDAVLRAMAAAAGQDASFRDPLAYCLTVFGDPAKQPWGWRFEGHHLSLNWSSVTGDLTSSTPFFLGANPAEVLTGPRAGLRVLGAEEDLARALLASLDGPQLDKAIVKGATPVEILFGPGTRAPKDDRSGLGAAEMSPPQRELLIRLLREYANNLDPDLAKSQFERIEAAGMDKIRFLWAGPPERGDPGRREKFYYRLWGPTFVIEYDNSQDGGNHAHSCWRDPDNDFGEDWLRTHLRLEHGTKDR